MARKKKNEDSRILAAVSYILGILGIVIYALAEDDKYVRFHALQATILGAVWIALWIVVLIITAILSLIPVIGIIIAGIMWFIFSLGILAIMIYLAYRAYTGNEYRIPWISDHVERYV